MEKIPIDIRKAITASAKTASLWEDLTPIARRDFVSWIESAKQEETRKKRIGRMGDMLASGKRRPCCYALVPMDLYKLLGTNAKAKATWSSLSADKKRDFLDWVAAEKDSKRHSARVASTISLLEKGRQHP